MWCFLCGRNQEVCSPKWMFTDSSSNNPNNLPLLVATRHHQLLFNSCWNVCVFHKPPPHINYLIYTNLMRTFFNQILPSKSGCALDSSTNLNPPFTSNIQLYRFLHNNYVENVLDFQPSSFLESASWEQRLFLCESTKHEIISVFL